MGEEAREFRWWLLRGFGRAHQDGVNLAI